MAFFQWLLNKLYSTVSGLELLSILGWRHSHCTCKHPHEMRQVVEAYKITYFRHSFLRMFQQIASRVQTVLRDKLRKGHPFAPLKIGTERRTVHAHFCRNIIQRNGMNVMLHHVYANLLHTPNVLLDTHRFPCKYMVGRGKNDRKQTEHRTQTPQFVHVVYFG